jgi:hypothetical protein
MDNIDKIKARKQRLIMKMHKEENNAISRAYQSKS